MTALWNPFTDMAALSEPALTVTRGEGACVFDRAGRRYVDGTAALWFVNISYGRTAIAEAVAEQIERLHTFHCFAGCASEPTLELAERLATLAPVAKSKVFLTSGGSDAIDTAAKLARRYFVEIGEPERTAFITREWAYHGMHVAGTSLGGMEPNRAGYGDLLGDVHRVPYGDLEALERAIETIGPERLAGLFCEPVIGGGGVRAVPREYLEGATRLVREAGGLMILDEVITGFGRVGEWFAAQRFGLAPDLLTFAKGVTSGYMPLGGVLVAPRVAEPFFAKPGVVFRHGYTYSGHAASCAAAQVNLDILAREELRAAAGRLEGQLRERLAGLAEHALVSEVRSGVGAMAAVQLDPARVAADPQLPARVTAAIRDAGVITRAIGGGSLQVSPPLVIRDAELDELAAGFAAGLDACLT